MRRPLLSLLLVALAASGLTRCKPDTVRLTFRPQAGARYAYDIRVRSATTIRLGSNPSRHTDDETELRADHTVLEVGPGGVRVRVQLRSPGSDARTFVVRFDRAAQLQEVESIEGLPAALLGDVGLSEIFPAAAGAPPDRPLRPGDSWRIDDPLRLPGSGVSHLEGTGRLVELGIVDGHKLASVQSRATLPVTRTTQLLQGRMAMQGTQTIDSRARHDLADGAVQQARSVTRGAFHVVLSPPAGLTGEPLRGRLTVEVRSDVKRLR